MLRTKTIVRDFRQTLFDNHVANVTLYLVDAKPEEVLFVCNSPILCLVYIRISSSNIYVHVYLRTMVDVCCLVSVPLNIPVNELVDYSVLCSNSYLTQVQGSAT